jgi:transforming growth factor-beta-induced protein
VEGRKRTVKITKRCCHGFARQNGGNCEKIDLYSVEETAKKLGATEFVKVAMQDDLKDLMVSNITVFVPLDAAFEDSAGDLLEKVSL